MRVAKSSAVLLIVAGIVILAGWQFRVPLMYGAAFGTFVAPNTALLFLVAGISWFLLFSRARSLQWTGRALVLGGLVLSAAAVVEHVAGVRIGFVHWLMRHRADLWTIKPVFGQIAKPTAIAFCFGYIGLATIRWRKPAWLPDLSALALAATTYLSLFGFLYGIEPLFGYVMAPHTAGLLVVFTLMVFASRHDMGIMRHITSPYAGGYVFRHVGTAVAVLMPLLGAVVLQVRNAGLISKEMSIAILVLAAVILFVSLIFRTAVLLNAVDRQRELATAASLKNEKLAAAAKLAASVAHEINNPLAAVMNLLYLAETGDRKDSSAYVQQAQEELRRVALIVKRSLAFYRDDSVSKPLSLGHVAEEVLQLFKPRLAAQSVQVSVMERSTELVHANEGEVRQVITNMVGNALDAMLETSTRRRPDIRVRTLSNNGSVELHLTDNGPGIPAKLGNDVFEAFVSTKGDVGTGLGLYVSRGLAHKNGGTLSFHTNDEGTTFVLALPRHAKAGTEAHGTTAG